MNPSIRNNQIIDLDNVGFLYPNSQGVENICISLNKGEFVILVGRTGSGKTTLFKLISLELFPMEGEINLMDMSSLHIKRRQLPEWRRQIGIVYQDLRLLTDRNTIDNIKLAAACEKRLPGSVKSRSVRILESVGLKDKIRDFPNELSTGEQQRIAIARALVNEPFLLLADEPVSNLDNATSTGIIDILNKASLSGTTVVVATHQPERFQDYQPRVITLKDGNLVKE